MTLLSLVTKYGGALSLPYRLDAAWQDSTGTTPAAVDSVIGLAHDLGPGGYHVTQGGSARPTLRAGSGLYWWEFDGVDDVLNGVTSAYTGVGATHYIAAAISRGAEGLANILGAHVSSVQHVRLEAFSSTAEKVSGRYRNATGTFSVQSATGTFPLHAKKVVETLAKPGYLDAAVNGVLEQTSTSTTGADTIAAATVLIGNPSVPMNFYGGLMLKGEPTSDERAFIQQELAALAGITF